MLNMWACFYKFIESGLSEFEFEIQKLFEVV